MTYKGKINNLLPLCVSLLLNAFAFMVLNFTSIILGNGN